MEEIDHPSQWPAELNELKKIDSLLRCSICFDFFSTAVIIPACSHTCCTFCIRKHITCKEQCPVCNMPLRDTDLKCNRILDELVCYFKLVREKLLKIVNNYMKPMTPNVSASDHSDNEFIFNEPSLIAPSQTCRHNHSFASSQPEKHDSRCPVCNESMLMEHINSHVDECLKKEKKSYICNDENSSPETANDLIHPSTAKANNPLPKCCFDSLTVKQLKLKAKSFGLAVNGNKAMLIRRLSQYTLLYNSQCDAVNPLSREEMAKQIKTNEKSCQLGELDRSHTIEEKEEFARKYSLKHDNQFKGLINQVREQSQSKGKPLRTHPKPSFVWSSNSDHTLVNSSVKIDCCSSMRVTNIADGSSMRVTNKVDGSLMKVSNIADHSSMRASTKADDPSMKTSKSTKHQQKSNVAKLSMKNPKISNFFKPAIKSESSLEEAPSSPFFNKNNVITSTAISHAHKVSTMESISNSSQCRKRNMQNSVSHRRLTFQDDGIDESTAIRRELSSEPQSKRQCSWVLPLFKDTNQDQDIASSNTSYMSGLSEISDLVEVAYQHAEVCEISSDDSS